MLFGGAIMLFIILMLGFGLVAGHYSLTVHAYVPPNMLINQEYEITIGISPILTIDKAIHVTSNGLNLDKQVIIKAKTSSSSILITPTVLGEFKITIIAEDMHEITKKTSVVKEPAHRRI